MQEWRGGQSTWRQLCASNIRVICLDLQVPRLILVAVSQRMDWRVGWRKWIGQRCTGSKGPLGTYSGIFSEQPWSVPAACLCVLLRRTAFSQGLWVPMLSHPTSVLIEHMLEFKPRTYITLPLSQSLRGTIFLMVHPTVVKKKCRASLVAQLVKNLSAMQEAPVWLLGWEDPLEKERATHSSILGLPWWLRQGRICLQCGKPGFDPWIGKIPWRRAWQPNPVVLPGEILRTEEPGRLQSMGSQRVGHDWATKQSTAKKLGSKTESMWG